MLQFDHHATTMLANGPLTESIILSSHAACELLRGPSRHLQQDVPFWGSQKGRTISVPYEFSWIFRCTGVPCWNMNGKRFPKRGNHFGQLWCNWWFSDLNEGPCCVLSYFFQFHGFIRNIPTQPHGGVRSVKIPRAVRFFLPVKTSCGSRGSGASNKQCYPLMVWTFRGHCKNRLSCWILFFFVMHFWPKQLLNGQAVVLVWYVSNNRMVGEKTSALEPPRSWTCRSHYHPKRWKVETCWSKHYMHRPNTACVTIHVGGLFLVTSLRMKCLGVSIPSVDRRFT